MKSADFNRTENKIRVLQEVRPVKKKVNWDRLIYFFFILAALLTSLYYVARNNLYTRAEGQVLFRKLDVRFTQDVQVMNLKASQGQEVEIGDTLFMYYDEQAINQPRPLLRKSVFVSNENLDWIVRERLTTQRRIEVSEIQAREAEKQRRTSEMEKNRLEKEIYLDIYPASKIDPYVHRMIGFQAEKEAAEEEVKFHNKYLTWLAAQEKLEREKARLEALQSESYIPLVLKAYLSPVSGTITQIHKENFEVALESEVILSVHKPSNLYIQAFYEQRDVDHIKHGDVVDVEFPDGTQSKGVVERFYVATYQLPAEFQKRYEPVTRSITAEITPIDTQEAMRWQAFYKLEAKISKPLFSFLN